MIKMSSQVETIVNAYKTLSKIPAVLGGKLLNSGTKISSRWSVRNLDKGKNTKFLYNYVLNDSFDVIAESEFGVDISNELLTAVSPRQTYKAVIREEKDAKDAKKQYLEVWQKNRLVHSIDLTSLDLHGDVYADSEFGSLDWSPDETAIVYVAEKKLQKSEPYIKRKGDEKTQSNGGGEVSPPKKGEEFLYRQDWGEQLVGKYASVIVVCQLQTETCAVLEGLPECWCPGQVSFTPDGKGVVGVAWLTEPRRLGLIFCTNRPSYVFNLSLDGAMKKLSGEGLAVRSPRFSPRGHLLWLQRAVGGPHHACHALVMIKDGETEVRTLIDIVQTEMKISGDESFYGLYNHALAGKGFSADGARLVLSTPQQNEVRTYVVDLEGGHVVDISNKAAPCSTSILDVNADVMLATCSSLTSPGQLYVARLPEAGKESQVKWVQVSRGSEPPPSLATSNLQYMALQHDTDHDVKSFSALYMAPKAEGKLPLLVWPHGGPHSGFVNAFSIEAALFNMLGMAILQVNYRGSVGAGDASVHFLLKNIGDIDVKDCELATREAIKQFPVDGNKLCLTGGSHGGFLVTHLSGQYPDLYKAVVTRNPVTDVASMFNATDIADWCAVEAGFEFTEKGGLSEEQLILMRRCSPLTLVDRVKAPTCMMLGSGDKRVPMFQGLDYARRLKANGVLTRIYMYDDNHSLSSPAAEMDNLINGARWLLEHLHS